MQRLQLLLFYVLICFSAFAQSGHPIHTRTSIFPDIPGYKTLTTDLHIHTVFSDGKVWPNIRVKEAIRDSLDVISITDHIEYLPHKKDIPPVDRNRPFEEAKRTARNSDLIVVRGTELTRELPPGHSNALFLDDVNPFVLDDPQDQFEEAKRQGAFVFWNHPSWEGQQKNTIAVLTAEHEALIKNGYLHGIEVVNGDMYSEHALQIALDNDLTIMGTSDIHELVDWDYDIENGGHRPSTLVFTTERSTEGVKDALFNRRTVVYYKDFLIGREEYLLPLLESMIEVKDVHYPNNAEVMSVTLRNKSSCNLILANRSEFGFHKNSDIVLLPHHGEETILVQTGTRRNRMDLIFEVMSAIKAPKTHPIISLECEQ